MVRMLMSKFKDQMCVKYKKDKNVHVGRSEHGKTNNVLSLGRLS